MYSLMGFNRGLAHIRLHKSADGEVSHLEAYRPIGATLTANRSNDTRSNMISSPQHRPPRWEGSAPLAEWAFIFFKTRLDEGLLPLGAPELTRQQSM